MVKNEEKNLSFPLKTFYSSFFVSLIYDFYSMTHSTFQMQNGYINTKKNNFFIDYSFDFYFWLENKIEQ